MPVTRWRVVCGLADTIETFSPTRRLSRLDLPVFGRPAMPIVPQRRVIAPAWRACRVPPPARRADARYLPRACAFVTMHSTSNELVGCPVGGDDLVLRNRLAARVQQLLQAS